MEESIDHILTSNRLAEITAEALAEKRRSVSSTEQERRILAVQKQLSKKEAALDRAMSARFEATTKAAQESCRRVTDALVQEVGSLRNRLSDLKSELERLELLESQHAQAIDRYTTITKEFAKAAALEKKEILASLLRRIEINADLENAVMTLLAI